MRWKRFEKMPTILIIEDEAELVRVLRSYLEKAGFQVISADRGDTGLSLWEHERPDLVLLDLNLPGLDGLDLAKEIRRKSETPMIMLTARVEEADRLIGLEIGADDYISKPFSPREVVARVRAVLRRTTRGPAEPQTIHIADLDIDLEGHRIWRGDQEFELTPTEFNLLTALVRQPGRVFSRLQLLEAVSGEAYEGYERTIDAHIKNLRAKLGEDPKKPRYIQTVFGIGYRFPKGG
jgi:two-component system alkaline phosphatase synthesis response regulator PhoP